jgi:hypothetical protein
MVIVRQEASKEGPATEQLIEKIKNALHNSQLIDKVQEDISLIEKALVCYGVDIQKLHDGMDSFYAEMLSDNKFTASDFPKISTIKKLRQFS